MVLIFTITRFLIFGKILGSNESSHFELDNIVESNRLFLKMGKNLLKNEKNHLFFELERFLEDSLGIKFEVYYVNRSDENQLRT